MQESKNERYLPARECFEAYCLTMWDQYEQPRHIKYLCSALQEVANGNLRKLIITMPPRHGKSMTLAEYFPAWFLGRHPEKKIIYTTYQQNLASDYGRKVRNQLLSPEFAMTFPNCTISTDSTASHRFSTEQGGIYYAVGRGAAITGKGAHIFICDDMFKDHKEAASKRIREYVKDFYRTVAKTRLEKDAAEILCGTRWHEDDLIGWVLQEFKDQNWMKVDFPAEDESKDDDDEKKWLWPEMFSPERYLEAKKTLGPYFWNALFQQRPSPAEGNILKKKHWRFWNELPPKMDFILQSWDMTFKDVESATSYVVGQVWGKSGPHCYLVDQFRAKAGFRETIKAVLNVTEKHPRAKKKFIEDKANGPAVIDVLKQEIPGIIPVSPKGTKVERANAVTYLLEGGNLYLPNPTLNPWVEDFIVECTEFPNGKNDDQVDAMTQALSQMGGVTPAQRLRRFTELK